MMTSRETGARLLLCVSESGTDRTMINHVMRRLEFPAPQEDYDHAVAGCGWGINRPFAVFFAPSNEVTCSKCVELLEGR
jgi:hypothetical protein